MLSQDDMNLFLLSPVWLEVKDFIKKDDTEALNELIHPQTDSNRRAFLTGIRTGYLNILKFIDRRAEVTNLYARGKET